MKTAIIVGATSGIGEALARAMINQGYRVGITGRRLERLTALQAEFGDQCRTAQFDITETESATRAFSELAKQMSTLDKSDVVDKSGATNGAIDIVVINSGTGNSNPEFPLEEELETVHTNVLGFTTIANLSYHLFVSQGHGHLVGISSVAGVRGGSVASYHASKAYVSSFLEGIACRQKTQKLGIAVTDIRPGFVDTAMAQGDQVFWMAPADKAAEQILTAIKRKKRVAYVTKRWRLIAIIMKLAPFSLYKRIVSS